MGAILPFVKIDSASLLSKYFTRYPLCWLKRIGRFDLGYEPPTPPLDTYQLSL